MRVLLSLAAAALVGASPPAHAQAWPSKPIRYIVPFAPGGTTDILARLIGPRLGDALGQPVVVENRPGAAGSVGVELLAKSPPDGYTIVLGYIANLAIAPSLYGKLPFDPDKDIRPIAIVATSGNMLVVHPSVPVNSVAEFVAFAKAATAKKEPIAYASGGSGTPGHLVMENFRVHAGFEAIHVPYRGNTPMVVDLVGGQVKIGFVTSAGMMDHVRAGRLKALAVARPGRSPLAPDVPSIAETGYPGFKVENYYVILAPAALSEPIAAVLEREVSAAMRLPDVVERLRAMDTTPEVMIGTDMRSRLKADREAWAKVVAAAGMRVD